MKLSNIAAKEGISFFEGCCDEQEDRRRKRLEIKMNALMVLFIDDKSKNNIKKK